MKIEVKNFGKIKKGQIDLDKRVTVFVGYNNSGKTYMSQLLWACNDNNSLSKFVFNSLKEFANTLEPVASFPITKDYLNKFISTFTTSIKFNIIPELFNVAEDYFNIDQFSIEILDDYLEIIKKTPFSLPVINSSNYIDCYHFIKPANSLIVSVEKRKFVTPVVKEDFFQDNQYQSKLAYNDKEPYSYTFNKAIFEILTVIFLSHNHNTPFFLPANRVFYPSYYKYIYSIAKEEKDMIDNKLKNVHNTENLSSIKALSKRPYTKAMDDLINKLYGLNSSYVINDFFDDLLSEMKVLIGGDIIIKSSEGIAPIEFYLKLDNGKELEMYMSSSSANQLTTLYLYLKYWAKPTNNYLIIDEPEENLHPENQIKLVNILMKFADRGNKILITTHSPLITDHINNYANLSYLNEAGMNTKQIIDDGNFSMTTIDNIKQSDYGVYFFNGDSIKEYAVDDYGAYFKDFQMAEDKVKNMSNILKDNIYNNIHNDGKE